MSLVEVQYVGVIGGEDRLELPYDGQPVLVTLVLHHHSIIVFVETTCVVLLYAFPHRLWKVLKRLGVIEGARKEGDGHVVATLFLTPQLEKVVQIAIQGFLNQQLAIIVKQPHLPAHLQEDVNLCAGVTNFRKVFRKDVMPIEDTVWTEAAPLTWAVADLKDTRVPSETRPHVTMVLPQNNSSTLAVIFICSTLKIESLARVTFNIVSWSSIFGVA